MRRRGGLGILAAVLVFTFAASVVVLGYHTLWRQSSRSLFSIQENRQLVNLGRSALSEGYYELQKSLDQGQARWFDWCTAGAAAADRIFVPARTRENAAAMSAPGGALEYACSDVTVTRVKRLGMREVAQGLVGVMDLRVVVRVRRTAPFHEHELTMLERRNFRFEDDHGPFGLGGRHVVISPTPAATVLESE
jgi:hypothetical protein